MSGDNNEGSDKEKEQQEFKIEREEEIDKEIEEKISRERDLKGKWAVIIFIAGILASVFHFYTAGFGILVTFEQRSVHMAFLMGMAFIMYPLLSGQKERVPWYDVLLAVLAIVSMLYIYTNHTEIVRRAGRPEMMDLIMGGLAIILVLEATRRTINLALPLIAVIFIAYAFLGPYMPGPLAHRGYSLTRLIGHQYLTTEGIFGIPIGVSATFVYLFVLFGAVLEQSGIGNYLIKAVFAALGHQRGGPAKAAVVTSGLMGMISGSSIANTVTTGSFTIPMMKKMGFSSEVAGGVESAASTNGQFLPPIMGAAAFIMIEFTGYSYVHIISAAFLPAVLAYVAIFGMVHIESIKLGISGISREEKAPLLPTLLRGIYFLIPIIILVYLLVIVRATPFRAAYESIWAAIVVSLIVKIFLYYWCRRMDWTPESNVSEGDLPIDPTRESRGGLFSVKEVNTAFWKELGESFAEGAKKMVTVAMACACAGIIIGVVTLTGLGLRMSSLLIQVGRGSIFLTLLLTVFASILLGMGIPTTAKYVMLATLVAPALVELGVPLIAAHLFILYFGVKADVTPPVALASYAAAGVSGGDPFMSGVQGFKFSLAALLLPFIFVYNPMMLMIDVSIPQVTWLAITATIGMFAWSGGIENYLFTRTSLLERIALFVFGIIVVIPGVRNDIIGLAGLAVIYVLQRRKAGLPLIPRRASS